MFRRRKKVFWKPAGDLGTGYLELDGRRKLISGIVKKTETLALEKTNRDDLDVNLDFDADNRLIGIEIVHYD